MAIYKLVENNNLIMSIPLSGCSEDLNREELKDNLNNQRILIMSS